MIKVAFYGDDFTGASDNAAQYARHGLRTLLFFSNPAEATLQSAARDYDVIGVAGTARSLSPTAMSDELMPVLQNFHALGVPLVQYKCCSTFDSSPETGSLGEAIRLMRSLWRDCMVPVLAATPEFGRYTLFGHHFARAGDHVHRLDRHPVMSRHPVTPMHESALSEILGDQGVVIKCLIDLRMLDHHVLSPDQLAIDIATEDSVVFDGYTLEHVITAAASLWQLSRSRQICAMAAQGFAHALGAHLRDLGLITAPEPTHSLAPVDKLLVLSGSCSALSAAQIDWALQIGFDGIHLSPSLLLEGNEAQLTEIEHTMLGSLAAGKSVVIYTARGPGDDQVEVIRQHLPSGVSVPAYIAHRIGLIYARLSRSAFANAGLQRLVVAGGDSSSFTMRELGAIALEIKASHFQQNAHVCSLISDDQLTHGKEVLLKGGQVGTAELYELMLKGYSGNT